jgi:hypothetical protein
LQDSKLATENQALKEALKAARSPPTQGFLHNYNVKYIRPGRYV